MFNVHRVTHVPQVEENADGVQEQPQTAALKIKEAKFPLSRKALWLRLILLGFSQLLRIH